MYGFVDCFVCNGYLFWIMVSYVIRRVCYVTNGCFTVERTRMTVFDLNRTRRLLKEQHRCDEVLFVYDTMEQ